MTDAILKIPRTSVVMYRIDNHLMNYEDSVAYMEKVGLNRSESRDYLNVLPLKWVAHICDGYVEYDTPELR